MVQKLGKQFHLSSWAKSRSLFLPNDNFELFLDTISPCNMALPKDGNNVTWIGYMGQTVTSGNFVGGPVCLDNHGDIITRSCGLPGPSPSDEQVCTIRTVLGCIRCIFLTRLGIILLKIFCSVYQGMLVYEGQTGRSAVFPWVRASRWKMLQNDEGY